MSSFKRNLTRETGQLRCCPAGFHPSHYNGAPITSTGIASLDDLLGGGLPVSSSFLIQEDHDGTYARLMLRYAMAQAVASNQHLIIVGSSFDEGGDPTKTIHRLMSLDSSYEDLDPSASSQQNSSSNCSIGPSDQHGPSTGNSEDEDEGEDEINTKKSETQRMKIAWRYENLQQHTNSENQYHQSRCHSFDLSKTMKLSPEQLSRIDCIDVKNMKNCQVELIENIRKLVVDKSRSSPSLRIVIQSIGSIGWPPIQDCMIFRFFKELQVLLGDNSSSKVAIISFPSSYRSKELSKILPWATSGSMSLHSFAGNDRSQAAFPNHQGAVEFIRLPCVASLSSPATKLSTISALGGASQAGIDGNLGFKLGRRRGFRIEMMGLGLDINKEEEEVPEKSEISSGASKKDEPGSIIQLEKETKKSHKNSPSGSLKPKPRVRFGAPSQPSSPISSSLKNTDW